MNAEPPVISAPARSRSQVTVKLLLIGILVLLLHVPLNLVNNLRQERSANREAAHARQAVAVLVRGGEDRRVAAPEPDYNPAVAAAEGYRMVERSLKHSVLVLTLVFTAFFLFETLAGLRLHAVHYGLVGAALCLFYLALLALGEVLTPGLAYVGAAVASSLLIVCYSISILHSYGRASSIAVLLAVEHSVLYVVLRMEDYALLAGTAALFAALAGLMFFTRNVDWFAQEAGKEAAP
ncbi:inner membrane CreD family protein [Opitutus sp. GAS368]|jgi:inner membrane protein|uniref:inner membrane CreD family protein n=1 Tax=Opitutus sp. GAS368 TaxID=1882749 RepID=UPI00087BCFC0|nr:inner membrane CreD family protein [Opitutus sp. GAS368]SDR79656.1 Inner membrane protein CreD [Opitutus sp. GAS368]